MLNSSLVGRHVPAYMKHAVTGEPATIEILSVSIEPNLVDNMPTIVAELKWHTGNPTLDSGTTVGSIAPGTMLWDALNDSGPIHRDDN